MVAGRAAEDYSPWIDARRRFRLSVQVMRDPIALGQRVSIGSFGWGGAYGTNFWIDPKEKVVGVLMIQMQGGSTETRRDFQNAVMQSIIE